MSTATLTRPTTQPTPVTRPHRAPRPRKPFEVKPYAPGAPIHYCDDNGGHDGTVWSAGPVPSTLWVLPADDPDGPVAVKVSRPKVGEPTARTLPGYPPSWQRDTVRRCDAVRRAGGVFQLATLVKPMPWELSREPRRVACGTYHIDGCPLVDKDTERVYVRQCTAGRDGVAWAVDILLRTLPVSVLPDFCRTCIYLAEQG